MPACARSGVHVPRQTHDCDAAVLASCDGNFCQAQKAGHDSADPVSGSPICW